jgi:hypothetical protein
VELLDLLIYLSLEKVAVLVSVHTLLLAVVVVVLMQP